MNRLTKQIDYYPELEPPPFDFRKLGRELAKTGDVAERARAILKNEVRQRAIIIPPGAAGGFESTAPDPALAACERLIKEGQDAVEILRDTPDAQLSPGQQGGLEAVVRLIERPALFVRNNTFQTPEKPWDGMGVQAVREEIGRRLPRVGRISARIEGQVCMVGTGFVVGTGLILTNRHVVDYFGIKTPASTEAKPDYEIRDMADPYINFKAEHDVDAKAVFKITGVRGVHPKHDLALLEVSISSLEPTGLPLPKAMALSKELPEIEGDLSLYVVGYPGADNEGVVPQASMRSIFGDVYEVKRLQPGKWMKLFENYGLFGHDCSTLGGNSGSCVVDMDTDYLIGLHAKGSYGQANYAIALPLLKDDPFWDGEVEFA